jgi:hypothetical protein
MTKNLLMLSLLLACAPAFAESDCSKSTDTCATGTKKLSPFLEASLRESKPPHLETQAKKAAPPVLPASTTAAAGLPAGMPAEVGGRLSSPAWLLLVIAGFAGLYFYLRGGEKKRRRK